MTGPCTIHIVDDDEPVRTSLVFALEAAGFRVASHADAGEFLARAPAGRAVLICDVRMPGLNGIELTRLIRRGGSAMPVILLTGHADGALQAEAMGAGADAVLEKPVALTALLEEVGRLTTDRL